eukprot:2431554-Lingulodinium_polyedra.AAC.1
MGGLRWYGTRGPPSFHRHAPAARPGRGWGARRSLKRHSGRHRPGVAAHCRRARRCANLHGARQLRLAPGWARHLQSPRPTDPRRLSSRAPPGPRHRRRTA